MQPLARKARRVTFLLGRWGAFGWAVPVVVWFALRFYAGATYGVATVSALALLAAWAVTRWLPLLLPGHVLVTDGALSWNGKPLFARGQVRNAIVFQNGGRYGVRLTAGLHSEWIEVATREDASLLARAFGRGVDRAVARFSGIDPVARLAGGSVTFGFNFLRRATSATDALVVLGCFGVLGLVVAALQDRWAVGRDGVLVRRGLRRARFLRYDHIERVYAEGASVGLGLRDGETLSLRTVSDAKRSQRPYLGAHAIAQYILDARDECLARPTDASPQVTSALARGGRDVPVWLATLRSLRDRATAYREAELAPASLWSALEDPAQPPEVRAAAAAALAPGLEGGGKERLRVAASACASPRLRVAIEAAARDDDAELIEALAAVEADADSKRTSRRSGA